MTAPVDTSKTAVISGLFRVTCDGFPVGTFHKAKIPATKLKVAKIPQAGAAVATKQPTGIFEEFDNLELEAVQDTEDRCDRAAFKWIGDCASLHGRTGKKPADAKRLVRVDQLDTDDTVVRSWVAPGFPVEFGERELESQKEDPCLSKLVLAVDYVEPVVSG